MACVAASRDEIYLAPTHANVDAPHNDTLSHANSDLTPASVTVARNLKLKQDTSSVFSEVVSDKLEDMHTTILSASS